jgi:hypothetical protein
MNHSVGLPWRIASLAGLLVGAISLLTGAGPWTSLIRVSLAFVVFGVAGFGLSFLLHHADAEPPAPGRHFDQTAADQTNPEDGSDNTPGS